MEAMVLYNLMCSIIACTVGIYGGLKIDNKFGTLWVVIFILAVALIYSIVCVLSSVMFFA